MSYGCVIKLSLYGSVNLPFPSCIKRGLSPSLTSLALCLTMTQFIL